MNNLIFIPFQVSQSQQTIHTQKQVIRSNWASLILLNWNLNTDLEVYPPNHATAPITYYRKSGAVLGGKFAPNQDTKFALQFTIKKNLKVLFDIDFFKLKVKNKLFFINE